MPVPRKKATRIGEIRNEELERTKDYPSGAPRRRTQVRFGQDYRSLDLPNFLEAVIRPADRVCLEGDNQKQADVLAAALADVDAAKIHDLHMVQSGVVLPEHLDVFEKGIARRLDYSYSGPQAARVARLLIG